MRLCSSLRGADGPDGATEVWLAQGTEGGRPPVAWVMAAVDQKRLFARLAPPSRQALEDAISVVVSRRNRSVEIEHWLLKLLDSAAPELEPILRCLEVDRSRLVRDLSADASVLDGEGGRLPVLGESIIDLTREAWLVASIDHGAAVVAPSHLLLALLTVPRLRRVADALTQEFARVTSAAVQRAIEALPKRFLHDALPSAVPGASATPSAVGTGRDPLSLYTVDLTARARAELLDPVLGREDEIRHMIDVLSRRRQNNPILTGEAGVGKTAVVEGFALKIAASEVPPELATAALRTLDLALLQAGAGVRGEFEERLKSVIEAVKASAQPIILFIDEAHMMIGAGGAAGQGDAANLLKPALARGELRTIAATTWAEYKRHFERDAALARRFQVIRVEEPTEEKAVVMVRGMVEPLEAYHDVRVLQEAVESAVRLSHRYLQGRQLPDKAVSLLDTACARVRLSQTSVPTAVEDARVRMRTLETAARLLGRERRDGQLHHDVLHRLAAERAGAADQTVRLEARWGEERRLVARVQELQTAPHPAASTDGATVSTCARPLQEAELEAARSALAELQGEAPLVHARVDGQAVASVLAEWTGIPVGRMVTNDIAAVLGLRAMLGERVIGQDYALDALARGVVTARAGLGDKRKPLACFLLLGPSGTGKTETAIALAELLLGSRDGLTVLNMSEFKEEHKASTLMGAPPGYVGYGEGGILTEAVRRRPFGVVLLDEIEKAHRSMHDIFYQVFDKGIMRDSEGREIDCHNTIFILTSNAGSERVLDLWKDPETAPHGAALAECLQTELRKTFNPAFLGRLEVVPYTPLDEAALRRIVDLALERVRRRAAEAYGAEMRFDDTVAPSIAARCGETDTGARNVEHILNRSLLPDLATECLSRLARRETVRDIQVLPGKDGRFRFEIT